MPLWQPTDSHHLQKLRLARGLSSFAVSQQCAISERQLLELEGQGEGNFYSEAIKHQTGLKVLSFLGDKAAQNNQQRSTGRERQGLSAGESLPLIVEHPSKNHRLLEGIGLAALVTGLLINLSRMIDGTQLRSGGVLMMILGLGIICLVRLNRSTWAVMMLCWGLVLLNFVSAINARGMAHLSWLSIPCAIMACAWFIGRRMAWWLTAASIAQALVFYAMRRQGYPFDTETSAEAQLITLIAALAVSALIGGSVSQTFGRQYELVRESRAELHAVMDSTRSMIWSVSAQDFSIRTFNRVFEREILQTTGVQLSLGQAPQAVFTKPGMASHWTELYSKALEGQGSAWQEDIFEDGRVFEVSAQPIGQANQFTGLALYAQDITHRQPV